jgi:hypothetical protein
MARAPGAGTPGASSCERSERRQSPTALTAGGVEAIVATDPLVTSDVMRPRLAEWQLVGIDLGAADEHLA